MFSQSLLRTALFCLFATAPAIPSAPAASEVPTDRQQITLSFAPLVRKVGPAVVNIYTKTVTVDRRRGPFGDPFFEQFFGDMFGGFGGRKRVQNALGSGVILDPDGLIVTNHHVIKEATEIRIVLSDRREFDAEVVVDDPRTDLAVLRVNAGGTPLPAVVMADSDELLVGDLVLAIGNPFGVGQTVTSGIVSALARTTQGIADYSFFIQTDAAINPGNSGGALIAMDGRLVGVNTAIFSNRKGGGGNVGIGFAVPSNMVRTVLEAARNGRVERPWVGARLQSVTSDLAAQFGLDRPGGAVITKLAPKGPFARAGLRVGDIILRVGGREVNDRQAINYRIGTSALGSQLPVDFRRRGAARVATVAMVAAPRRPAANVTLLRARTPLQGASIANMSPAFALETGYDDLVAGVRVMAVPRGSPAARSGFRPGDLLVSVNDRKIARVSDVKRILGGRPAGWVIAIRRNGKVLTGEFEG
ncbi:MAG: Do family serine endopeptidase [Pseudomonadota bacterium]|nr:Do family serine endopeptidase [Pseudomonadota bacterium]